MQKEQSVAIDRLDQVNGPIQVETSAISGEVAPSTYQLQADQVQADQAHGRLTESASPSDGGWGAAEPPGAIADESLESLPLASAQGLGAEAMTAQGLDPELESGQAPQEDELDGNGPDYGTATVSSGPIQGSSLIATRPAAELLRSSQMGVQRPMEQSQALSALAQLARSWAVQTFVPEVLSVTTGEQERGAGPMESHLESGLGHGQGRGQRQAPGQTLYGEAAEVFIRQAKAYMQADELDRAIVACQEALAVSPDLAETHKLIGNMLQEMGRGVDAMGHYARALLANPTYPEVYANLGSFYARRGEWEDAELYYRKALQLRPENAAFLKPLAKVLEAQGKAEDSSQTFAQFLALEPTAASAEEHYRIGEFFREQGDETKAIESYRRAVNLDEAYSPAYRPLAELLEKQGDWQAATAYYRKVLQSGMGIQQSESGSQPAAVVSPGAGQAQSVGQSAGQSAGQSVGQSPSQAQVSLQELLKQAKQVRLLKGPEQLAQNGRAAAVAQPSVQAKAVQRSAVAESEGAGAEAVGETSAENYARSGQLQAKEQNWERAIEYYQKSLQLKPRQPEVLREFARVLTQAGQPEQAAQAWYRAFRLEPDWATAEQCYNLGDSLAKQGKLEQATVCYKLSIRRDAQFGPAYEHLGRVLELQEDPAGAMAAYRKALAVKEASSPVKK